MQFFRRIESFGVPTSVGWETEEIPRIAAGTRPSAYERVSALNKKKSHDKITGQARATL